MGATKLNSFLAQTDYSIAPATYMWYCTALLNFTIFEMKITQNMTGNYLPFLGATDEIDKAALRITC